MKFVVYRTRGGFQSIDPPCPDAVIREQIPNPYDYESPYIIWELSINSIDELYLLTKDLDESIIMHENLTALAAGIWVHTDEKIDNFDLGPAIEIYDDYRE